MSQREVYEILRSLGGRATPQEIAKAHKKKDPSSKLEGYVWDRLNRLGKWGYIRKNPDGSWSIVDEYPPAMADQANSH